MVALYPVIIFSVSILRTRSIREARPVLQGLCLEVGSCIAVEKHMASIYKVWMFIDVPIGVPIFINLFAILLLTPKFLSLLRDYRARYMNIGEVDPNFKVFYEE